MRTAPIDRRTLLKAAGAGFLASLAPRAALATERADALFAAAFQKRDGGFGVALLTDRGELVLATALPERGHDVTFDPLSRRSVVFARRPGTFMVVVDHQGRAAPQTIVSPPGRHFFGHGLFSPDGKLLYATENDFDTAEGMVGIYDATASFRRLGEFATHGTDPHEMLLMPDGRTLAVANGGIETHPDFGRAKLNIATMQPSLVFLDRETGGLVEKHQLEASLHQLSIRHMDLDGSGRLWFGCQYEGASEDAPLLVGRAAPGEALGLVDMPEAVLTGFRNYIGSVAANPAAGTVAVSSPEGNQMAVLDASSGKVLLARPMTEVCGLAADGSGFLATTGTGDVVAPDRAPVSRAAFGWDNHILRLG